MDAGTEFEDHRGKLRVAYGTGVIANVASARGQKTGKALAEMEWVVTDPRCTRDIVFIDMPAAFMEALPPHMRERARNIEFKHLDRARDCVVLLDDTAMTMNSRDSATKEAKAWSRMAGGISHLGITLILTTQSVGGIDVSLMRYTQLAPCIGRMSKLPLRMDMAARPQWRDVLEESQWAMPPEPARGYSYSAEDELLCRSPFRDWMNPKVVGEQTADVLTRPLRYHTEEDLHRLLYREDMPEDWFEDAAPEATT